MLMDTRWRQILIDLKYEKGFNTQVALQIDGISYCCLSSGVPHGDEVEVTDCWRVLRFNPKLCLEVIEHFPIHAYFAGGQVSLDKRVSVRKREKGRFPPERQYSGPQPVFEVIALELIF